MSMSTSIAHLCFSFFLLLSILYSTNANEAETTQKTNCNPPPGKPLITEVCEDSKYQNLCISALLSDPVASTVCINKMGPAVVNIVLAKVTETGSYTNHLLHNSTYAGMKGRLLTCSRNYNTCINNLKSAVKEAEEWKFMPVLETLTEVKKIVAGCEEGFKQGGLRSPLMERNKVLRQLGDVAWLIISDLEV